VITGLASIEIARIASVCADVPEQYASWMSESEQARLADIRFAGRRSQYLTGHWLARVLLARAFGGTPASWRLRERRSLPPEVAGHDESIRVSISHTRDWIAAAVATVAVGIDLEQRPRALDPSIESLLRNDDEIPGSLDPDALLRRWVAKEAWIKRNTESALPARLKRLHVRSVAREHADVCIDSHAAFHFGLAIAPGCAVTRRCEVSLVPGAGIAITDLHA
jgi:4'-phosphopantetheinyl transferase